MFSSLNYKVDQQADLPKKEKKKLCIFIFYFLEREKERKQPNKKKKKGHLPSCLFLPCDAHGLLGEPRLLCPRGVRVSMCVLQHQEGVGGDGALALALGAGQQVVDGQLSGGERDGGNLGRGGEGLQLLEVLLLLHQLVEQHLLLLR